MTRITLPLEHATDLHSAVSYAGTLNEDVLSYAIDNGAVVGEYAPRADFEPAAYIQFFKDKYGTEPLVVGIVVAVAASEFTDKEAEIAASDFGLTLKTFVPAPVLIEDRPELSDQSARGDASVMSAGDWRPDSSSHQVYNYGGSAMLASVFTWTGGGLYSLPNEVGLEFEINQDNPNVATPQNQRPLCFDAAYKDRFWAKNYNWSWSVTDYYGTSVSALGAYADYNDLSDLCRSSSIGIGLRYPKALVGTPFPGGTETTLEVFVLAPRGTVASNKITGNVQAVSDRTCNYANVSLTDCMGVAYITNQWGGYPAGTYNRATLGSARNAVAPGWCWSTWDKGGSYARDAC